MLALDKDVYVWRYPRGIIQCASLDESNDITRVTIITPLQEVSKSKSRTLFVTDERDLQRRAGRTDNEQHAGHHRSCSG